VTPLANPLFALRLVRALVCLAVAYSSLELLLFHREFRRDGMLWFGSAAVAPAQSKWTRFFRNALQLILGYPAVLFLLALRMAAAFYVGCGPAQGFVPFFLLLFILASSICLVQQLRFGLTGGDQMVLIMLGGLTLCALAPGSNVTAQAFLWFAAGHVTIAYVVAGTEKLRHPLWPSGLYLSSVMQSRTYGHPSAARILTNASLAKTLARLTIVFQCLFPLALLTGEKGALLFCAVGLIFHLLIAMSAGLKLFFLIFVATYPAILYCSIQANYWLAHLLIHRGH
jgi:hypothetical protein